MEFCARGRILDLDFGSAMPAFTCAGRRCLDQEGRLVHVRWRSRGWAPMVPSCRFPTCRSPDGSESCQVEDELLQPYLRCIEALPAAVVPGSLENRCQGTEDSVQGLPLKPLRMLLARAQAPASASGAACCIYCTVAARTALSACCQLMQGLRHRNLQLRL